jgi:HTH-type transcriptional regulator / antitoxin HigA
VVKKRRPVAEVFPPGDVIREELEARGWTQSDLAAILGRPFQMVNAICNGRKAITPQTARELEAAFGASAEFWMNLEIAYRLHKQSEPDPAIRARAGALAKGRAK